MKLELTKDELKYIEIASSFAYGTNWFQNAIGFRVTDKLNIYINNLSEYYDQTMDIENGIEGEWEFAIDAPLLSKIISKSKGSVVISEKGEEIIIESGGAKFTLKKLHYNDLPKRWDGKADDWINIDQQGFIRGLEMQFAAPKKHMKYQYTGVSIIFSEGLIEFATTNEFKIAAYKHKQENTTVQSIIIPYEFVSRLRSVIPSNKYSVKLLTDGNKIFIYLSGDNGKILMSSLLINSQFPAYQQLFQQTRGTSIKVKCDDILGARDNLSILAQQGDYNNVYIKGNEMRFEYISDHGNIDTVIDIVGNGVDEEFTLSQDFYQIVSFIKRLGINEVELSRVGRFIFFNIEGDYDFLASAMDLGKKPI